METGEPHLERLRTALVTGAGIRVGRAIAQALASRSYAVAIHYRGSKEAAEETAHEVTQAGGRAVLVQADLTDRDSLRQLVARSSELLGGPLGALVNNASRFEPDSLLSMTEAEFDAHMAIHVTAPVLLSQYFARQLPENCRGDIVHLLDQRVLRPNPLFFSYTLSKMALHAATRTMAQALAPNIRVNAVAPGPTLRNARQSAQDFQRQRDATLLGTGSRPQDIAACVAFLLEIEGVTGQTIAVDGAQNLIWLTPDIEGIAE